MGKIVGHEMTHLFSTDSDDPLWSREFSEAYQKATTCLTAESDDYALEMNSTLDLDETLADFSGTNSAWGAYGRWVEVNGEEGGLLGLPFTPQQLFWISEAMCYCSLEGEGTNVGGDDGHAAPKFRVEASLSNNPHFGDAFKCPVGSKMNPVNKCRVF